MKEVKNVCHPELDSGASTRVVVVCKQRAWKFAMTSLKDDSLNKNVFRASLRFGFTLIEMLVVVLIIGILVAVALPQYNKAVEKSKSAQAVALLKTVYQAAESYYLANGQWPTAFNQLDVQIPWTGNTKWYTHSEATDTLSNEDWSIQLHNNLMYNNLGVYVGRISGPYAGAGFVIWHICTTAVRMPTHTLLCVERKSQGVVFEKKAGAYCQKLFHGEEIAYPSGTARYYTLP